MKKVNIVLILFALLFTGFLTRAGNPDRAGQAGATQLLFNPWPRATGWHGVNYAGVQGVEAMRLNVAGLLDIHKTEFLFGRTNYLMGSGIAVNSFGFAQKLGEGNNSVLGVSLMTYDLGEIEITTGDMPEGGLGTFSPNFTNIGVAYARKFSNAIRAGALFRVITEGLKDVNAVGAAIDAGIQYRTDISGKHESSTRFGISIRNVGTPMKYTGNALARRAVFQGNDFSQTVDTRSKTFELPSMLNIGVAQDIFFSPKAENKLTLAASFTSNAFSKDQFRLGAQYSLGDYLSVRGGFYYEDGLLNPESATKLYTGPSGGVSFELPFGPREKGKERNKSFGIDYSYRATSIYKGVHVIGARLEL